MSGAGAGAGAGQAVPTDPATLPSFNPAAIYLKSGNNVRVPIFLWCFVSAWFGTVVDDEARASIPEFIAALGVTGLQTVVLARVFLVLLLGDRNQILADAIASECEVAGDDGDATVVAVLGMAHLNGVKRILEARTQG